MEYDKIILGNGEDCVFGMDSSQTHLNNNICIVGASGSGKTMSIVEPRLLEVENSNLIVTVTKRRIVEKYKNHLKKKGYDVLDLNFISPEDSDVAYDPLEYIESFNDIIYSFNDITYIARAIVMADPRKDKSNADPYWDQASVSLLTALIVLTIMTKDNANFTDVLEYMDKLHIDESGGGITTTLDVYFDYIKEKSPECFAVSCWNSFRELPVRTARCVYSSLNVMLDTIFTPEIRTMIKKGRKLNFEDIANKKTVVFVSTSPVNTALNSLIAVFYGQVIKQMVEYASKQENYKLPIPLQIICDDFATGGRILNFSEYISIFREMEISAMILLQSEKQLDIMYGENQAAIILDNCDTYIYMGSNCVKSARNTAEKANIPLDSVLYMPFDKEIIFRRGIKPIFTERYNITQNEQYKKVSAEYERRKRRNARIKTESIPKTR